MAAERVEAAIASPRTTGDLIKYIASKPSCVTVAGEASAGTVYKVCKSRGKQCETSCYAVKIAVSGKKLDESEARVQQYVNERVAGTPAEAHVNHVYAILPGPMIVSEYERPHSLALRDVKDVISKLGLRLTREFWKSLNFQFILTMYTIQQHVPGFSHNDTHTENVLLVPNEHDHVCKITSPKGRHMAHYSPVLLKIIDFGQALSTEQKTQDGEMLGWMLVYQNKMIDYLRFAVWAIVDYAELEAAQIIAKKEFSYPEWYQEWFDFLSRWFHPDLLPNGPRRPEYLDKSNGFGPNEAGAKWLQSHYGPKAAKGIGNLLDDPYFDEFVTNGVFGAEGAQSQGK